MLRIKIRDLQRTLLDKFDVTIAHINYEDRADRDTGVHVTLYIPTRTGLAARNVAKRLESLQEIDGYDNESRPGAEGGGK